MESFHGRFRDECLNREQLYTLSEARVVIEGFRRDYNATRPHSSLGYQSSATLRPTDNLSKPWLRSGPPSWAFPPLRHGLPTQTITNIP